MSDFERGSFGARAKAMSSFLLAGRIYESWFPGKYTGDEFSAINTTRGDKSIGSFNINSKTGIWCDFASGEKGADLVDLYAYYTSTSTKDALIELELMYGAKTQTHPEISQQKQRADAQKEYNKAKYPCTNFDLYDGHDSYLKASKVYEYKDKEGKIIGYKAIYSPGREGKVKEALPWTIDENGVWQRSEIGWHKQKPIYGLWKFNDIKDKVLIVEGEKCANEAQRVLGDDWVVLAWHGGCSCAGKVDWSDLPYSEHLYLWPDDDKPVKESTRTSLQAMVEIRSILGRGIILDPSKINKNSVHGWDIADAIEEGWARDELIKFIETPQLESQSSENKSEISNVPPEIANIYSWILKVANEKHHKFAIQACFCLLSALTNGSYETPTGGCLGIYSLLIAQASGGKGAYVEKIMSIARKLAPMNIAGEQGSRQALRTSMTRKSNVLTIYNGELGVGLSRVLVDNGVGSQLSQDFLDFWGKVDYAEGLSTKEGNDPDVINPRLSMYGGTTMTTFRDLLSRKGSVSGGFMSRLDPIISNIINVDDESDECDEPLSDRELEMLKNIAKFNVNQYFSVHNSGDDKKPATIVIQKKKQVSFAPGVKDEYKKYKKLCKKRKLDFANKNDAVLSDIYGRCFEKSLRYASLLAIAGNPENPVMTIEHFTFSMNWVEQFTEQLVEEACVYGNTSVQKRIRQSVLRYLKRSVAHSSTMRDIRKGTLLRDEDVDVVKRVMTSMEEDGLITSAKSGKTTVWTLTKEGLRE